MTVLDQTRLPHAEAWVRLETLEAVTAAIRTMQVRGAPLIGITAAYGLALALRDHADDARLEYAAGQLLGSRPTAVNLRAAVDRVRNQVQPLDPGDRAGAAWEAASALAEAEARACRAIGDHGLAILRALHDRAPERPVRVLTHCNAGWLATLEYGTALAPVYRAAEEGLPVAVIADETRPRNQGWLTAWELRRAGIPVTVVADNASGHLLQRGEVDVVLVGTDRTARNGDVCNKIGTWLKALAADDAGVPFYAAVPSSSIDWEAPDGRAIPIEERNATELREVQGLGVAGLVAAVRVGAADQPVANPAFDVTPARYLTGLITERGVAAPSEAGLLALFPERA